MSRFRPVRATSCTKAKSRRGHLEVPYTADMARTRPDGRLTEAELSSQVDARRSRERRIRYVTLLDLLVGLVIAAIAIDLRNSSLGSCEPGSPGCSLTNSMDVAISIATGVAALLLLAGILVWIYNNKQAARTTELEVRLARALQRRESAGFAAHFDGDESEGG